MSSAGRREMLHLLLDGATALGEVENELANTQRAHADARDAVENARMVLEAAEARRHLVEQQITSLVARRDRLRLNDTFIRHSLRTMATFSPDVLRLIFEEACAPGPSMLSQDDWYDPYRPLDGDIDWGAVRQPWRLVAVCKTWRAIGLDFGRIWSYIAIPASVVDSDATKAFMEHFNVILTRSCNAPLDVVIRATCPSRPGGQVYEEYRGRHNTFFASLSPALMSNVSRIRTLSIMRQGRFHLVKRDDTPDVLGGVIMDILRCSTPRLEVLILALSSLPRDSERVLDPTLVSPTLLPRAPVLRTVAAKDIPLTFRPGHPGLPSLKCFQYRASLDYVANSHFWDTYAAAPKLEDVTLDLCDRPQTAGEDTRPESLPFRTLKLCDAAHHGLLDHPPVLLPRLTALDLPFEMLRTLEVTEYMQRNLTILVARGLPSAHDIAVLRQLRAVEAVTVVYSRRGQDALMDALCDSESQMWPQLCFLSIRQRSVGPGALEHGGALLRLISLRNSAVVKDGDCERHEVTRSRSIERLEFDEQSVPVWEAMRLAELLGDRCIQIQNNSRIVDVFS